MRKYTVFFLLLALLAFLISTPILSKAQAAWQPNTAYAMGDQVTYGGHLYKCIQGHTSLTGWEPPNVPALWQDLGPTQGGSTATPVPPTTAPTDTPVQPTATQGTDGGNCWTPYVPGNVYTGGMQVSYNGHNWTAKWWTQNEAPSTGGSGVWTDNAPCGSVSNATNTPTFVPPTINPTSTANGWPGRYFASYVDTTLMPTSLYQMSIDSGTKYFILAFINDGGGCTALWAGNQSMSSGFLSSDIASIRAAGGDVIPSFGGANTNELALKCPDVNSLQTQYQSVIDTYNLTHLDFNIEGDNLDNSTANDLRNRAIAGLQATARSRGKSLVISYTLPVATYGLLQNSLNLLNNAVANGVDVGIVNVMAMNYGPSGLEMADAGKQAMNTTINQLANIFTWKSSAQLWHMLGVTPMIGLNGTPGETFTLSDASTLLSFVQSNNLGELSIWSANRDFSCPGGSVLSPTCSGIDQSNYQFSGVFNPFTQ